MARRARIRLASPADGEALALIYRPAVVDVATSFELEPPGGEEMGRRVSALIARLPWLIAERNGDVAGYAYASPHRERAAYRWCAEVSAYVAPGAQRGGVGWSLYSALFDILALQRYRNAYAGITLPNEASERFHERMGFTLVGVFRRIGYKFGRWHDVAWYERELATRGADPAPPRPLDELVSAGEIASILGRWSEG